MRKVACSRLYINNEEFYNNQVVELLNHSVSRHYPLSEETAMTEWLGGVIVIVNEHLLECNLYQFKSLKDIFMFNSQIPQQACQNPFEKNTQKAAIHISEVNLDTLDITAASTIRILRG